MSSNSSMPASDVEDVKNVENGDRDPAPGWGGPCTHEATRLCHGTLRWVCDDCGAVAERSPAERLGQLQSQLNAAHQRSGSYNRRRRVA